MPGFLSEYEQTTRLTFGSGPDGDWWVEVRRFLSRGDFKVAQAALVSPIMRFVDEQTETTGMIDSPGYQNEIVFRAVMNWNLTDANGDPLPLAPDDVKRSSIDRLPGPVFDAIFEAVEGAAPKKKGSPEAEREADPFPARGKGRAVPRR